MSIEYYHQMDTSGKKIVALMDCVEAVEEELDEGMDHEHRRDYEDEEHEHDDHEGGEHEYEHKYDEHVWTSPRNAKLTTLRISDSLCEADPENAADYKQNTDSYTAKLDELDAKFHKLS